MTWQYFVKGIWSGTVTFLGAIGAALIAIDGSFGQLSDGVWVVAIGAGLVAFGGVLGWQATPSRISTSTRN